MSVPTVNPGQWLHLPGNYGNILWRNGSGLSVDDTQGLGSAGKGGFQGALRSWCSALYDEKRGHYVDLNSGGHAVTSDNSVFAFDIRGAAQPLGDAPPVLNGGPQAWSRWRDPSQPISGNHGALPGVDGAPPPPSGGRDDPDSYSDGAPPTTHSYGGMQHMLSNDQTTIDKYFVVGGNKFNAGNKYGSSAEFDPRTKTYAQGPNAVAAGINERDQIVSCWDTHLNRVLLRDGFDMWSYIPLGQPNAGFHQLTTDGIPQQPGDHLGSGCFDKRRYRFLMAGYLNDVTGRVGIFFYPFNPNTGTPTQIGGTYLQQAPVALGGFPVFDSSFASWTQFFRSPNVLYDEIRDDYVLYNGGPVVGGGDSRNQIFRVHPDTWAVTIETSTGRAAYSGDGLPNSSGAGFSVPTGGYNKMRQILGEDLYIDCVGGTEGIWLYRPANSARTFTLAPRTPQKWFGQAGINRVDVGTGAPGGRAGGVSTGNQDDKFARGVFDTTRNRVTMFGGNTLWFGASQVRGQNAVLQIDPSAVSPAWSTLIQVCEGPSKQQLDAPENPTAVYDGPQLGVVGPGRDLFYVKRGGYNSPLSPDQTTTLCGSFQGGTLLTGEAVLVPSEPAYHDAYAAPYSWKLPSWGAGGDTLATSGVYERVTDSIWRLFKNSPSVVGPGFLFLERQVMATGNFVAYALGQFDHGNNELADLRASVDFHREHQKLDPVGGVMYVINHGHGKLLAIDLLQAHAITPGGLAVSHNTLVVPASQGQDYTKQFTIPGFKRGIGADDTHQAGGIDYDSLNRRVLLPLIGGTSGDVYSFLAFNRAAFSGSGPGTECFETLPLTSPDYDNSFAQGHFIHGDWGVYSSYQNVFSLFGGKKSGNPFAASPPWNPTTVPFSIPTASFEALYGAGDPTPQSVISADLSTLYTQGVDYSVSVTGPNTILTRLGAMATNCIVMLDVPKASEYMRFRYAGGPGVAVPSGNPNPALFSLNPNQKESGAAGFTLTINGSNFVSGCTVTVGTRTGLTPLTQSSSTLTVAVLASDVAAPGAVAVTVTNPAPGGGTSGALNLLVTDGVQGLTIAYQGLLRDCVGQGATALAADGANDGTVLVTLQGHNGRTITKLALTSDAPGTWRTDSFGTSNWVLGVALTQAGALINNPSTMAVNFTVADGGTFYVFASDAGGAEFLGGRTLNLVATFTDSSTAIGTVVISSSATVGGLNPASCLQGQSVTVDVTGSGFTGGSVVSYDGVAQSTTPVNANIVRFTVTSGMSASVGGHAVTVSGATGSVTFTVNAVPTLLSLNPAGCVQNQSVTVEINGTGFTGASQVSYDGAAQGTTFQSAAKLTFLVTAAMSAVQGTHPVTVNGVSGSLPFTVAPQATVPSIRTRLTLAGGSF